MDPKAVGSAPEEGHGDRAGLRGGGADGPALPGPVDPDQRPWGDPPPCAPFFSGGGAILDPRI